MKNPAENPYQVGIAPQTSSAGEYELFYKKTAREEEEKAHDHKQLPFTIQTITDQIGDVFVKLVDIRQALTKTKGINNKNKTIDKMQDKIDDINKQIFDLTNYLHDLDLSK